MSQHMIGGHWCHELSIDQNLEITSGMYRKMQSRKRLIAKLRSLQTATLNGFHTFFTFGNMKPNGLEGSQFS